MEDVEHRNHSNNEHHKDSMVIIMKVESHIAPNQSDHKKGSCQIRDDSDETALGESTHIIRNGDTIQIGQVRFRFIFKAIPIETVAIDDESVESNSPVASTSEVDNEATPVETIRGTRPTARVLPITREHKRIAELRSEGYHIDDPFCKPLPPYFNPEYFGLHTLSPAYRHHPELCPTINPNERCNQELYRHYDVDD